MTGNYSEGLNNEIKSKNIHVIYNNILFVFNTCDKMQINENDQK